MPVLAAGSDAAPAETVAVRAVRRRSRMVRFAVTTAAILAAVWCVYWVGAYAIARAMVADGGPAETGDAMVACSDRVLGGFPLRLTMNCARVVAADGPVRASLGGLAAAAPLYDPGRLNAEIAGPFRLEGPGYVLDAVWARADATVDAGITGPVGVTAAFGGVRVRLEEPPGAPVWAVDAAAWGTDLRPAEGETGAIRLRLSAEDFVLTLADTAYPRLSGNADLKLTGGPLTLGRDPVATFRGWLGAGGALRVDRLTLISGDVTAEVTGDLALHLDGTLSGVLDIRYSGERDLPLLVAAVFPFSDAVIVADALMALSRPIEMNGAPALEIRLNLDHGVVSWGFFEILTIPSVGSLAALL